MSDLTPEQRAEALAMLDAFYGCGVVRVPSDGDVRRWLAVRDQVLAAHECPTVPVWRPTTCEEIQSGWEVRARRSSGSEAVWGIAHRRDDDGDWRTGSHVKLTYAHADWTYETTAPLPEPWDEALVAVVSDAIAEGPGYHRDDDARRILDALAARGYLDRAAITGGGQS